jgi:hypothetical protein
MGHELPDGRFVAMAALPQLADITGDGRTGVVWQPSPRCRPTVSSPRSNHRNEPSFTQVAVEIGVMPKLIEIVLHAPSEVPTARSQLVEAFEVGGTLGRR